MFMEYEGVELLLHAFLDLLYMSVCDQPGCFPPSESPKESRGEPKELRCT
jgi:hypothetical protein